MSTLYTPYIGERDYGAFRSMMPDALPETYGQWEYLDEQQIARLRFSGHAVRRVDVNPAAFRAFCRAFELSENFASLERFVWDKVRVEAA